MALLIGSGDIVVNGDCKVYDLRIEVPLRIQGSQTVLESNHFTKTVTLAEGITACVIHGNRWVSVASAGLELEGNNDRTQIVDNYFEMYSD